jgi:hypothetical protein|tara:strand:+ start:149 stop:379 length:231 start_codon:yes stop_codon:yes gene_type:complete
MSAGGKKGNVEATNVASLVKAKRERLARKRQEAATQQMMEFVRGLEKFFGKPKSIQLEVEPNVINITDRLNKKRLN